jgi:signal peptidase I
MSYLLSGAGAALAVLIAAARCMFLITTVDGTSMEPALRSGDRILVRRAKRVRAGQVVVFRFDGLTDAEARRSRFYQVKRVVAVPGDRLPARWEFPDIHRIAGTVVPSGSIVVLGDNREVSWDSRHHGLVRRDRFVGVMIRQLDTGGEHQDGRVA